MEPRHESLAGIFDECARMLRAHAELYDESALDKVQVVAALAVRVARSAARGATWGAVVSAAAPLLVSTMMKSVRSEERRHVLLLLAGARRGWRAAEERFVGAARERNLVAHLEVLRGVAKYVSACPRCSDIAERELEQPAPCEKCGFVFSSAGEEPPHMLETMPPPEADETKTGRPMSPEEYIAHVGYAYLASPEGSAEESIAKALLQLASERLGIAPQNAVDEVLKYEPGHRISPPWENGNGAPDGSPRVLLTPAVGGDTVGVHGPTNEEDASPADAGRAA